jgi:phenylalanyl-tRNA synthetase beta chain
MLELGQPMHAFDLSKLDSGIRVRNGRDGERLTLLDGSVVEIDHDALVIADESRPIALAGVMGGLASGVDDATTDIFLESAWFEPRTVALEARRRGMHTDASHRFERTVASDLQRRAMERATGLLVDIAGGEPGPVVEAVDEAHTPRVEPVALRRERIRRVLGAEIPARDVADILIRLGMQVDEAHDGWTVTPPPHRPDIGIEVDLIEEVARVVGFANLPGTLPVAGLDIAPQSERGIDVDRLRGRLIDRGYHEAVTYSFVDAALQARIAPALDGVALANPISSDMGVMRTTLWPGLIRAAVYNANRQQSRIRLFETGLVFIAERHRVHQPKMIGAIAVGPIVPEQWGQPARTVDFYDVKGDVESLLALSGRAIEFTADTHPALHPGQTASIVCSGERIGMVGALHPALASEFKLPGAVLFELRLESISTGTLPKFKALSRFPAVRRDLSLVVPGAVSAGAIRACVEHAGVEELENLELFDVYIGEGIDSGMKSISLALTFQSRSRTLGDTEVNTALGVILDSLSENLGAALRE